MNITTQNVSASMWSYVQISCYVLFDAKNEIITKDFYVWF